MKLIKGLQRGRLMTVALLVAGVIVGAVAVWHASRLPAEASGKAAKAKQSLQAGLQRGVGSEVRFASAAAKPEQIDEAVKSTADFIYWRSGLRMSDEARKQLMLAESKVLKGEVKYLTVEELTDKLTAVAVDRLATITDEEIQQATEVSADAEGHVTARASGKWGALSKTDLIQQAKSAREWSQKGDGALQTALRSMIAEDVNDRVSTLAAALPEQFGQAARQGITPSQALLIAYSVAADDPLTDSRSDIQQQMVQRRIDSGQTREQKKAETRRGVTGRPYGPYGFLHPSAPHLFLNKAAMDSLLNLSEGGKN